MNQDWTLVCRDPHNLKNIENQTKTLCLKAISLNSKCIEHVREQTEELCWAAIKKNCHAILNIKKPTIEMWDYVLSFDRSVAKFLDVPSDIYSDLEAKYPYIAIYHNRTEQVWLQIIETWTDAFPVRENKTLAHEWTPLVIDTLISSIPLSIKHIPNLTYDHCRKAVELDGNAITRVPKELLDEDLCWLAYKTSPRAIKYLPKHYLTESFCLDALAKYPSAIVYMPKEFITYDMWFDAVKCDVRLFQYVPEEHRSEEMCYYAIKRRAYYIEYVHEQTEELCRLALKQSPEVIQQIIEPTDEMKWFALKNGVSLHSIENPTEEMIEYALQQRIADITAVKNLKPEWVEKAIRFDPYLVIYLDVTEELKWSALRLQPNIIRYIRNPSMDMKMFAVQSDRELFIYVASMTEDNNAYHELALLAVDYPDNLQYVKYQTEEICLKAVSLDGSVFEHCHYQTQEIIDTALANVDDPDIVLRWLNQSSLI